MQVQFRGQLLLQYNTKIAGFPPDQTRVALGPQLPEAPKRITF